MKPVYYFLLLLFFIIGCEKESNDVSYANELFGKWIWLETCGGFSGGCWYSSKNHQELHEFTYSNKWIITKITNNGITLSTMTFTIGDSYESNKIIYNNITFSNGGNAIFWFLDHNTLMMSMGDIVQKFRRLY